MDGLTSRLGFRGNEDLGGGASAFFNLESRFKPNTGQLTVPERFFEGRSVVGLRNHLGEVTLGRDYIPAFYPAVNSDPFRYDQTVGSVLGHQFAGFAIDGGSRQMNAISYKTPSIKGVTALFAYSTGEGARSNSFGFNVEYNQGPAYFAVAAQRTDLNNNLALVVAGYKFETFRIIVSHARSERGTGIRGTNSSIGFSAPVGAGEVKAVYARFDPDIDRGSANASAAAGGATRSKFGFGYEHLLSKRTSIYTSIATGRQYLDGLTRTNGIDLGMRHRF